MARMATVIENAQRHLGEPVLAAIGVHPGSFSTVGGSAMGGTGSTMWAGAGLVGALGALFARRLHLQRQAAASDLPMSVSMVLAVTPDRIHLLQAGSRWTPTGTVATWFRSDVRMDTAAVGLTREIVLEIPSEGRRLGLEVAGKRATREFVAALAALGDAEPRAG